MTHPYHIKITGDKLDAGSDLGGGVMVQSCTHYQQQ